MHGIYFVVNVWRRSVENAANATKKEGEVTFCDQCLTLTITVPTALKISVSNYTI